MERVYERCCGLDVHKKTVVAGVLTPGPEGRQQKAIRTFGTMTDDLLELAEWLSSQEVTHVAMESTGVYWKPVWNTLEDRFELLLVNARHIKAVPGRKTDVRDCEWIADLLSHGLLKGSFVPDRGQRELRELTRYREALVQERTAEVNRLQKTLEGANIKLSAVVADVAGVSARQMLQALIEGRADAASVAELAKGRMREKLPQLERALSGRFGPHQRFLVAQQLAHIDGLDEVLAAVEQEIEARTRPFEAAVERLDEIPGISSLGARCLLAEIGWDMSRFASERHLSSWAGMCPGNHESAGKRFTGKTRKGNRALRTLLVGAAHAAARKRTSYLSAQYHRLAARRGKKRAVVAVGHSILVIAYHLLKHPDLTYQDLGAHYFDHRDRAALKARLVHRLESLGFHVNLQPLAA